MSDQKVFDANRDPVSALGLPRGASEQQVRSRYLELVRQFPPDREPEKFREIHAAYQSASDPLLNAQQLLDRQETEPPPWSEIIAEQQAKAPRLAVDLLLSLGNERGQSEKP